MNFEDGCVQEEENNTFREGRVYVVKLKDIKKFSYTNLNEPFGDFDLPQIVSETEKYGKVYTPVMFDFGSFVERFQLQKGIVLTEYIGNDCFQIIDTDMILHVTNYQSESFSSLDRIEEDIAGYRNHYLSIEKNSVHMFDEKLEQKYSKFRNRFDNISELFDMLNKQAEKSLQINLIRLETNEMIDAVYDGNTTGKSKTLIREMQCMKRKIIK